MEGPRVFRVCPRQILLHPLCATEVDGKQRDSLLWDGVVDEILAASELDSHKESMRTERAGRRMDGGRGWRQGMEG